MNITLFGGYRHKRTGKVYIVNALGKMKIGNGEWTDSVSYSPADLEPIGPFTRDKEKFIENFEEANPVSTPPVSAPSE